MAIAQKKRPEEQIMELAKEAKGHLHLDEIVPTKTKTIGTTQLSRTAVTDKVVAGIIHDVSEDGKKTLELYKTTAHA